MGTPMTVVDELSFNDQLATILDAEDSYTEKARENEADNKQGSGFATHTDFQGTPEDPYTAFVNVDESNPHRPEVSTTTERRLRRAVKAEKGAIPVEKLDFGDNLGILLDAAERYYESLQCEVVYN